MDIKQAKYNIEAGQQLVMMFREFVKYKQKLNQINDISHYRLDEVDIHLRKRLDDIQIISEVEK